MKVTVDYRESLKTRDIVVNSTWLREDGTEMYVILSENDESCAALVESLGCSGMYETESVGESLSWIRIARMRIIGKPFAGVDIVFIPLFLGQVDKGMFKRIG